MVQDFDLLPPGRSLNAGGQKVAEQLLSLDNRHVGIHWYPLLLYCMTFVPYLGRHFSGCLVQMQVGLLLFDL